MFLIPYARSGLTAYGVRTDKDIYHLMQNPFKTMAKVVSSAYGKVCDTFRRIDAYQRKSVEASPLSSDSHECMNCKTSFTGNYCPRCGQSAGVSRFTFKQAISRTLEVWGLGNRSLPRTLLHLIYRPGYMIGDYLEGRQAPFFPPVKMLFLVTTAYIVVSNLVAPGALDIAYDTQKEQFEILKTDYKGGDVAYKGKTAVLYGMNMFYDGFQNVIDFFSRNHAIELIFIHGLLAVITMYVFRKSPLRPHLNLTECFFSQIFIACQLMTVSMIYICLIDDSLLTENMYPIPTLLMMLIFMYDYKQLYGFSLLRTAWYTVKAFIGWFISMMILVSLAMVANIIYINMSN